METPAAQQWLDRKMSRRDDVVSALVLVSSSEGLRTAAVWPRGTPAQHALADAARSTFASGSVVVRTDQDLLIPVRSMRGSEEPVHDPVAPDTAPADTDVALRAQRVMAKPIFSRGRRVGALAFALREDAPFEPTRTSAPPTTTPTPPAPSSTRMGGERGQLCAAHFGRFLAEIRAKILVGGFSANLSDECSTERSANR
jgi:hypothetical protein